MKLPANETRGLALNVADLNNFIVEWNIEFGSECLLEGSRTANANRNIFEL